jgi:hypothetical protein
VTTVAASVAVICAVAFTNSAVLADAEGSTVASPRVVVPSASTESPAAQDPREHVTTVVIPETVQAPDPVVVPHTGTTKQAPQTPALRSPSADQTAAESSSQPDEAVTAAAAAGNWDEVREWARAHGWSPARTDAWISRLQSDVKQPAQAADKGGAAEKPGGAPGLELGEADLTAVPEKGETERKAAEQPKRGNGKQPANTDRSQLRPSPSLAPSPSLTLTPTPVPDRTEPATPAPPPEDETVAPDGFTVPSPEHAATPSQRPDHAGPPAQTPPQVPPGQAKKDSESAAGGHGSDKNQSRDSPNRRG